MNQVTYTKEQVVEVLRALSEIVVSLDRIGSASSSMPKEEWHRVLADFIVNHQIIEKTAKARRMLSEPFDSILGADGMDELERQMQDVPYWTPCNGEHP